MNKYYGEGYITQIKEKTHTTKLFGEQNDEVVFTTTASDVALRRLRETLLFLNGGLLLIIPVFGWFLTKKTLDPVQKSNEQQRQFVSDASHELRTPLSIMSGEMEIALKNKRTVKEYREILQSNKEEVDRMTDLVENLLLLARVDKGYGDIVMSGVDITDMISSIIAKMQFVIANKKLHIDFFPPDEILIVRGEEILLRQLFTNLIDNAVKYTPDKGIISVQLKKKKGRISVKIKDTGPGIAFEDRDKIFDRFYRTDVSRSKIKGYGLGLAIVKSITELHNGRLFLQSKEGKGSTFEVELPLG